MSDSYNELMGLGAHSEDAGLELHYPMLDSVTSTTVVDNSSNGRTGTLQGGDNTSDISTTGPNSFASSALHLDGTNDYIDTGYNSSLSNYTLFVRCKSDTASPYRRGLLAIVEATDANEWVGLSTGSSNQMFGGHKDSTQNAFSEGSSFGDAWHSVAVTNDGSTVRSYKDGVAGVTASSTVPPPAIASGNWMIGESLISSWNRWDGPVSETALFSRTLTADEVGELAGGPELGYVSGVSWADSGTFDVGTWTLPAPFASGSNGPPTYSVIAANAAGSVIDSASTATGSLDISAEAGNTVYLLVRVSNTGGYDIGDHATRTSSYGSANDGYYEIASVTAAAAITETTILFDADFSIEPENTALANFNAGGQITLASGNGTIGFWNVKTGDDITGGELVLDAATNLVIHDMASDRTHLGGRCHYMKFTTGGSGSLQSLRFYIGESTSAPKWFVPATGTKSGFYVHETDGSLRDIGSWRSSPTSNYQRKDVVELNSTVELALRERGDGMMGFVRLDEGDWDLFYLEQGSSESGTISIHVTATAVDAIQRIMSLEDPWVPTPIVQHSFSAAVSPSDGNGQPESGGGSVTAAQTGSVTITSNELAMSSDGDGLVTWDVETDDWIFDGEFTIYDDSPCGVVVRYVDSSNYLYAEADSTNDELHLIEVVSGIPTTLVTEPFNPGSLDTYDLTDGLDVRFTVRNIGGTFLSFTMFPGSLHDTYLESTTTRFNTSTKCGVFISKGSGVSSATAKNVVVFSGVQNNFPLPGGSSLIPQVMYHRQLMGVS